MGQWMQVAWLPEAPAPRARPPAAPAGPGGLCRRGPGVAAPARCHRLSPPVPLHRQVRQAGGEL